MSDFRRHSSIGGGARQKVKIEYSIKIKEVAGLPKSTTGALFISWKRGSKKENSGETKHVAVKDQKADFDYSIPLISPQSLLEKGKKPTTLGKLAIDLAEFANSKTERIRTFQIKEKKTPVANITLSFKTTWLKMDGKTLVRADQAEASGKQKVEIDGNDYYLQTEDEMSVDETDQKSGGGNDSDEEAVDFESDSETGGGYPKSPNKRKSITPQDSSAVANMNVSSLLPKGAPSTPTTVASPPSPSPSSSTSTSTTTTPSIQVTSPVSDHKDGEDPKVKKYKKKLKTARKEVDDIRAELTKKEELLKAAQQGGAASAESAAQIAALQKKEQESQESVAKLRSELDEANKKVADAHAEVEASRKGGDEANKQKDAKIKQLEETLQAKEAEVKSSETKQRETEQALEVARQDNKGRAELESKISALEEAGRRAEKRVEEYEQAIEGEKKLRLDLEHKLNEEKQRADEKENRIKELENELQGEKHRNVERGSQEGNAIQELQKSLEAEKQKAHEWETKFKQADELARSNEERLSELEKQLTKEKESSDAEIARLGLLVVALEKEKAEKAQLESQHEQEKAEHEATIEALKAKVASLEEQIKDSVNARAREGAAEVELLKSDLSSAEERAIQAEKKAEGLQKRISEGELETSHAKKKLEEEVQRLQKRTKELEMQMASESGKDNELVADLQARAAELEAQLQDVAASNDSQAKQINQLSFNIQELEEEKEKTTSAKEKAKEARNQLEAEIDELKDQVATLEGQVKGGSGKEELISELQSKNKDAETEILQLKQQLEDAESATQEKERELEHARENSNRGTDDAALLQELEEEAKKYKKKAKKAEEQALDLERQLDEAKLQLEQQQQNGSENEDAEVKFIELDKKYRAVKTKVEELDDEADRLRKREIVLSELNETSERRIEELEVELKSSKQHSATNGGSGENGGNEEVAELQKELEEMMSETAKLKVRVRELEEEAANAKKASTKSLAGSGAIVAGGSEEVVRLQKELEEHKKVEKAIYWDEVGFTPADISKTATSVWQLMAATRELDAEDQPADQPLTSLAQKVITALDKSFRRASGDNKQIAYWLSCTCSLLHFIHQRDDIPPSADPVLQGVQVNGEQFVNGPSHAEQFARALQEHALNVYGQLAVNFQEHIQKVIIPAFLREDQAVMDSNQKGPAVRASSYAVLSSPPSSPQSPHSLHHPANVPSLTLLTNTLSSVHTLLREAKCPAAVVRQFFHQLLHFVSGCVLNALLYGKEVSTATHGLRIKLAVSRIDEWLAKQDNDIAGTGERLNLLRDTANVLVLDKSLFLDADTITSIFHTLNLVQVRKLLDLFQPDSVSPAGVPPAVKQMMDTYWGYSPHNMPLLVDVTALVVVI